MNAAEKSAGLHRDFFRDAFRRAKSILERVFKVVWKFADFIMLAAGNMTVIGPGITLIQKAIGVLIEATKNYREIFIKAAELFEQVGFFSMRFEMFMEAEAAGVEMPTTFVSFKPVLLF